jgi:c-di-GMP-binding flagellar brake protein YcgR
VRSSEDADEKNHYKISVEYERMSDEVRDILTRHVLNKEQQSISKASE